MFESEDIIEKMDREQRQRQALYGLGTIDDRYVLDRVLSDEAYIENFEAEYGDEDEEDYL